MKMDGRAEYRQDTPSSPQAEPAEAMQEQQKQAADHNSKRRERNEKKPKPKDRGPLFAEPLSRHPVEEKLARIREVIAAGADVNGLDDSEPACHREGHPLDACLRVTHMANGATFYDNVHVIELLLEHGADPRLRDKKNVFFTPLEVATWNAEKDWEGLQIPQAKPFYERVLAMFKKAIAKLDESEKNEKRIKKGP